MQGVPQAHAREIQEVTPHIKIKIEIFANLCPQVLHFRDITPGRGGRKSIFFANKTTAVKYQNIKFGGYLVLIVGHTLR